MRTDKEIESEIEKLQALDKIPGRWNSSAREILSEQWGALCSRSTLADVDLALEPDETCEDYRDEDSELYNAVVRAVRWMNGEKGFKAPSEEAGA